MSLPRSFNRARMTTTTTGTGTVTLAVAVAKHATFGEASVSNADVVSYFIEDGDDFEIGIGTYTASGTTLSRDTVILSKIAGVSGTSKLTLSGAAEVGLTYLREDILFAAAAFGTDNRLLRSDGTGKGVQPTGITVDDSDNITGVASIAGNVIATQANQETATSLVTAVSPGRQHFHPSAVKGWLHFTVSGTTLTVQASYNMGATRSGVGVYAFTLTVNASSANYAVSAEGYKSGNIVWSNIASRATTGFTMNTYNAPGFTAVEVDGGSVIVLGDL